MSVLSRSNIDDEAAASSMSSPCISRKIWPAITADLWISTTRWLASRYKGPLRPVQVRRLSWPVHSSQDSIFDECHLPLHKN